MSTPAFPPTTTRKRTNKHTVPPTVSLSRLPYSPPPQPRRLPHVALRRRVLRGVLAGCLSVSFFLLPAAVPSQTRPPARHTVDGTVVDAAHKPVTGAVVYLENPRSLDVQSYLSDAQGHFHFNQVSPQTDYEVWAEQNGVESKHRFISQFSSHVHFNFVLQLTPGKKKKFLGIF